MIGRANANGRYRWTSARENRIKGDHSLWYIGQNKFPDNLQYSNADMVWTLYNKWWLSCWLLAVVCPHTSHYFLLLALFDFLSTACTKFLKTQLLPISYETLNFRTKNRNSKMAVRAAPILASHVLTKTISCHFGRRALASKQKEGLKD
jgi:hypothetical protein